MFGPNDTAEQIKSIQEDEPWKVGGKIGDFTKGVEDFGTDLGAAFGDNSANFDPSKALGGTTVTGGDVAGATADFVKTGNAKKAVGQIAGQALGSAAGATMFGPMGAMIGGQLGASAGGK